MLQEPASAQNDKVQWLNCSNMLPHLNAFDQKSLEARPSMPLIFDCKERVLIYCLFSESGAKPFGIKTEHHKVDNHQQHTENQQIVMKKK